MAVRVEARGVTGPHELHRTRMFGIVPAWQCEHCGDAGLSRRAFKMSACAGQRD